LASSAVARRRFLVSSGLYFVRELLEERKERHSQSGVKPPHSKHNAAGGSDTRSGKRVIPCPPLDNLRPRTEFIGNERRRLPFVGVHLAIAVRLQPPNTEHTGLIPKPPNVRVKSLPRCQSSSFIDSTQPVRIQRCTTGNAWFGNRRVTALPICTVADATGTARP